MLERWALQLWAWYYLTTEAFDQSLPRVPSDGDDGASQVHPEHVHESLAHARASQMSLRDAAERLSIPPHVMRAAEEEIRPRRTDDPKLAALLEGMPKDLAEWYPDDGGARMVFASTPRGGSPSYAALARAHESGLRAGLKLAITACRAIGESGGDAAACAAAIEEIAIDPNPGDGT